MFQQLIWTESFSLFAVPPEKQAEGPHVVQRDARNREVMIDARFRHPFPDLRRLSATQALRITSFLRSQKELEGDELIVAGKHNSDRAVLVKRYIASSVRHFLSPW
jgi:hypothetical protein